MARTGSGRTGRRPGNSGSREAILVAARERFAARGYEGASIRAIAAEAQVDPSLVMHFFGNKEGVFVAAMDLPFRPSQVIPALLEGSSAGVGERLARFFVTTWDNAEARGALLAMVRSAMTNEQAAALLRGFVERELIATLAAGIEGPKAPQRASLVAAQMVGLAVARYVVGVEPLASASADEVVATVAPALQSLLAPPPLAPERSPG